MIRRSECKGCGAPMIWGRTSTGAKIPLDPRAPVYEVTEEFDAQGLPIVRALGGRAMVSHFKTCPKASEFSGQRKADAARD